MTDPDPLVLTLRLDPGTFARLDRLRAAHFPPGRNVVPAHVTLFHALPGAALAAIAAELAAVAASTAPVPLTLPGVRFLGRGVAIDVRSPELVRVRKRLADGWAGWLTPQDRQPYRPHVTVQNKAEPTAARLLFEQLSGGWDPLAGVGDGLLLWHYRGGPWEPAAAFAFAAPSSPARG